MVAKPRLLIVDDDPGVRDSLTLALSLEGFDTESAARGDDAIRFVHLRPPDVMLLDVAMQPVGGLQVLQAIRRDSFDLPVCILSARDQVDDRVAGLAAGADDYVVKPFAVGEVAARLKALIRLKALQRGPVIAHDDLHLDTNSRRAFRSGRDLDLTAREFDLLEVFLRHPGQVLSRTQLLELVWGYTWNPDSNVVDVFVGYLRRKLEAGGEPRCIRTVRGLGYGYQS